jgi:GNAT superfamily N-acetyltransferase
MELRLPTIEQLRTVYDRDMREAFPPAELKPLSDIERMWQDGWYTPWCLFDGDNIVGECFLWRGHSGWALLDYLCTSARYRNGGLGAVMLSKLAETEPDTVIFGEAEVPAHAPDPAMAERRLAFYARNGLRLADYDTEMFGVHYKTLYLAKGEVDFRQLMEEHRFVYENTFSADKFHKYVRIPFDSSMKPGAKVSWQQ